MSKEEEFILGPSKKGGCGEGQDIVFCNNKLHDSMNIGRPDGITDAELFKGYKEGLIEMLHSELDIEYKLFNRLIEKY